jgi:hypothetical protein
MRPTRRLPNAAERLEAMALSERLEVVAVHVLGERKTSPCPVVT